MQTKTRPQTNKAATEDVGNIVSLEHVNVTVPDQTAANLFWINERQVVSNATTGQTNHLLRDKGYEVIELDFSQLVCLWGSFRCVVCPLERE